MGPGTGGPGAGDVGIVPLGINCDPGDDWPPGAAPEPPPGPIDGSVLDREAQGEAAQPLSPRAKSRTIKKPGEFGRVVIVSPWKPGDSHTVNPGGSHTVNPGGSSTIGGE